MPQVFNSHKETTRKMFIAYINLLIFGAFFIIVASIVLRQLFLQEIWRYIDLKGDVTNNNYCFSCETNRVLYFFFIHEGYLVRF